MKKLITLFVLFALLSCSPGEQQLHRLTGEAFGTTYSVQYYGQAIHELQSCLDSTIGAVNRSVSTYLPDSDISRINRGDSTLVIDETFKAVFELSKEVHSASNGYFDPTIGVLRNAYGFGEDQPLNRMDSARLDSLMRLVGFDKVKLSDKQTVIKALPGIYLDFNAVAKGYGIDLLAGCLDAYGNENYLIELGGELKGKGRNLLKHKPWMVGIERFDSEIADRDYSDVVRLEDAGMASSGNYRKFRIDSITGKKYVHTIDPLTGLAQESDLTSATVITATCATADAYATAFMAMGLERSKALLGRSSEVHAYLTYIDSTGNQQVFVTPGFRKLLTGKD